MSPTRRTFIAGLVTLAVRPARAQAPWPTRLVRLISSSPPAGASDILSRTLANALQGQLGQSFVVENRPGGGGIIGADAVAKSAPDGYTWLTTAVGLAGDQRHAAAPALQPPQGFSARHHHRPTAAGDAGEQGPAGAETSRTTWRWRNRKPGKLNFGTGGVGTLHHLTGELLKLAAGIDIVHVPYRGAQAATQDLLGGRIESMFDSLPSAVPHLRAGTVRGIAVSGAERSPAFPDIPTMAEQGFPQITTHQLVRRRRPDRRAGGDRRAAACRDRPRAGDAGGARPVHRHRRRAGRRHARCRRRPSCSARSSAGRGDQGDRHDRELEETDAERKRKDRLTKDESRSARERAPRPCVAAGGAVLHHPPRASRRRQSRRTAHRRAAARARRAGHRA